MAWSVCYTWCLNLLQHAGSPNHHASLRGSIALKNWWAHSCWERQTQKDTKRWRHDPYTSLVEPEGGWSRELWPDWLAGGQCMEPVTEAGLESSPISSLLLTPQWREGETDLPFLDNHPRVDVVWGDRSRQMTSVSLLRGGEEKVGSPLWAGKRLLWAKPSWYLFCAQGKLYQLERRELRNGLGWDAWYFNHQ